MLRFVRVCYNLFMQSENDNQQSDIKIAPRLSQLPEQDTKGMYRRLAWLYGFAPVVVFLLTVYVWSALNLFSSVGNIQPELLQHINLVVVPAVLGFLPFTLPIGMILAIYFATKAKSVPVNLNITKSKRSWWKVFIILILILIALPVITVLIATTNSNNNNCGFAGCSPNTLPTVPRVPTAGIDDQRKTSEQPASLDSISESSKKTESEIEDIVKQSTEFIQTFAGFYEGIEIETIAVNKTFQSGKNEFNGAEFTLEEKHVVLSVMGTADERKDLMGVTVSGRVIGYVPQLRTSTAYEVILPLSVLDVASNIPFEVLILVDTQMF